jgi:hypothetical protein
MPTTTRQWGDAWINWSEHPCSRWDKDHTLRQFRLALQDQNEDLAQACMNAMDRLGCWHEAFEQLTTGTHAGQTSGEAVLWFWHTYGFHVADSMKADPILAATLKTLLPPCGCPAQTLYRGEALERHQARIYGMSWTTNVEVARMFAGRRVRGTPGGVLLKIAASPEMIFCAPNENSRRMGEHEYLIDPRMIHEVEVLESYPGEG